MFIIKPNLGCLKRDKYESTSILKTEKILLSEGLTNDFYFEDKVNSGNAAAVYFSSRLYQHPKLLELSLSFIEHRFSSIAHSQKFRELDFLSVVKVFSSDRLNVDSELQVARAANSWLCHKFSQRIKHANNLLFTVRCSLLSVHALSNILSENFCFAASDECVSTIEKLKSDKGSLKNSSSTSRYCNHDKFDIVVCGGVCKDGVVSDVRKINANNLNEPNAMPKMKEGRSMFGVVCVDRELFVFGGKGADESDLLSVERFSRGDEKWEKVGEMPDDRMDFCACAFMGDVYVVGGFQKRGCWKFYTKYLRWKGVAALSRARPFSACCAFEGRLVVSGGIVGVMGMLGCVEAYDHAADLWAPMPKMVEPRCGHKTVAAGGKLFAVGGRRKSSEVFDSSCGKFALLKAPVESFQNMVLPSGAVLIGDRLVVLYSFSSKVLFYDVVNGKWASESCEWTKSRSWFGCAKISQL